MPFASHYLSKHRLYDAFIPEPPHPDLMFTVVIPSYDEPRITETLDSLWQANRPRHAVEVIVVVNAPEGDSREVLERNRRTLENIANWKDSHKDETFTIHTIHVSDLPAAKAGAGLARKIGMDEAVTRFNQLNQPGGWIISLDADTRVAKNYFQAIERHIEANPKLNAGVLYFEHPLEGNEFEPGLYEAIIKYELFLRYYNQALRWAGYPYAFQTIGSAFCVKAEAYAKQGGMNTKRAGEDFYFLNKVFQLGGVKDITDTAVYPSPRPSGRVLFGTGPEMIKWSNNNHQPYLTYHQDAFKALKTFMEMADRFYKVSKEDQESLLNSQDPVFRDFLASVNFQRELHRINNNCNNPQAFRKHFFHWFNGLRIIRFIHIAHEKSLPKIPLHQAASRLLEWLEYSPTENYRTLLETFRQLEHDNPGSI
jgi:hypothetical protein